MRWREANKSSRAEAIGGKLWTFRTGFDPASQSIMPVKNLAQACRIGLDFFEFLKESNRTSITDRLELRDIYNTEFRSRTVGAKDPNFGSVLHALKVSHKITRRRDQIRFNPSVRNLYTDQWHSHRSRQPETPYEGANSPGTEQEITSGDEAVSGVRARRRLASLLMNKLKKERSQFISDKNGISINSNYQFENGRLRLPVDVDDVQDCCVNLRVENTAGQPVYFMYYTPLHWLRDMILNDERKVTRANPLCLESGDSYEVQVLLRCSTVGVYPATIAFEFKLDLQSSTSFHIVRFIEAHCLTTLGRELAPVAAYRPQRLPPRTPEVECPIVDGLPPEGFSKMQLRMEVPLKPYKIPTNLDHLIQTLTLDYSSDKRTLLESPLSWQNYKEKFQLLLHLEEQQMEVDIKRYNIPNHDNEAATMTRDTHNKKLLVLKVPGVSENRPSVLRGDSLLAYPAGEPKVKYRGYVHSVELDCVKLGFSSEFVDRWVENMKFHIEFVVNRLTMRVQHRAAELAVTYQLGEVLFPAPNVISPNIQLPNFSLFDAKLERNPQQYLAVRHIVAGTSRPAPYLVFGPPGTGKTVTMVEAVKQIAKKEDACHILACAPSNSAADLLCRKILENVEKRNVFRMYASSRDPRMVPEELKECSNLQGDCYIFPAKEELMKYKIVVTTLITAGRLVTGGLTEGHFTHMFVDEAGHAVETECLIPLAGLLNAKSGQVVLAGDPKQLGPIVRSPFAVKYGMGVSLLERLMKDCPLYQKNDGVFDNRYVTKLLHNYRSHPAILKVPNELFYDGELQACADQMLRESYCSWQHLPKRDFPLIFHGVTGIDEREESSPSFFNVAEVEVLMDYVRKLLQSNGKKGHGIIAPREIGIIAPYRKQVQKIRSALKKVQKDFKFKDMNGLKVGSVEEFQGQERKVILVSTVRSSPNYTEYDQKFCLGFVKNEKRFNVAVTRAKALLIVVGNPKVLTSDATWARFINYCKDEEGYKGFTASEDDEDVVYRLAALYIAIEPNEETEESAVQRHVEPEWRNDL